MYNPDFLAQMEKFRRSLWSGGAWNPRQAAHEASQRAYFPPANIKMIQCHKDPLTGEIVPMTDADGNPVYAEPPKRIEMLECVENTNGEWVPKNLIAYLT